MKVFHFFTSLLLIAFPLIAYAEMPFSVSIDTFGGYNTTTSLGYCENDIELEKTFDELSGLTFNLENSVIYDQIWSDEITASVSVNLMDFLSVGLAPKVFIGETTAFGLDGLLTLGLDIEEAGFSIEDENEFLYLFEDASFQYINTLGMEKLFSIDDNSSWGFAFENVLVAYSDLIEDSLTLGPVYNIGMFSIYANYCLGITPELTHGAEAGKVMGF